MQYKETVYYTTKNSMIIPSLPISTLFLCSFLPPLSPLFAHWQLLFWFKLLSPLAPPMCIKPSIYAPILFPRSLFLPLNPSFQICHFQFCILLTFVIDWYFPWALFATLQLLMSEILLYLFFWLWFISFIKIPPISFKVLQTFLLYFSYWLCSILLHRCAATYYYYGFGPQMAELRDYCLFSSQGSTWWYSVDPMWYWGSNQFDYTQSKCLNSLTISPSLPQLLYPFIHC